MSTETENVQPQALEQEEASSPAVEETGTNEEQTMEPQSEVSEEG